MHKVAPYRTVSILKTHQKYLFYKLLFSRSLSKVCKKLSQTRLHFFVKIDEKKPCH